MRPDLLLWLAESHRNFHVAGPNLSESLSRELWSQESWTQGIIYEDFPLLYEPRSLARSPDGRKIVVGTKAGFLLLASWDGLRWCKQEWQIDREFKGKAISRSIRALRFLDNSTVVAGWGEGFFGIFDADSLSFRSLVPSEPTNRPEEINSREHEWLGRFARFITLVPSSPNLSSSSAVMLGVTRGSQVHVLYRNEGAYSARTYLPEDIFPGWGKGARVVDGVWSHDYLWVLDSSGQIYRYAPAAPQKPQLIPLSLPNAGEKIGRTGGKSQSSEGIFHLGHPREIGEFRALAACVMGLAVLTSDDITFLRFNMPKDGTDLPSVDPTIARWIAVPAAIDCSVCLPFCSYYPAGPLASQTITQENPVWTVVGSSHSGLRWISWHDPKNNLSGRLPAVSHSHRAGSGDSSVLQIRFGFFGRGGPTYIACATRDHRLRIATLLDRKETESLLSREIPRALAETPSLAQESGISWWLTLQRIATDFNSAVADDAVSLGEPRNLLRFTEREDLYRLIRRVLKLWSESPISDSETKKERLQDWIYHILGRAYQIDQYLAQDLARLAHDRIAQMRGRRGDAGRKVEEALGLFAAFLRKWVVYGHTYGEKPSGLLQLYDWNRSGHILDALTYLTKLLRRRVDPLWESRPASGATGLAVWDLAAPVSGAFSVHCSADGRITAVGRDGERLPWESAQLADETLKTNCLEIYQGQLRHLLAEEFIKKYRHGPYARELLLMRTSENGPSPDLLIFCLRGWRREDQPEVQDERKARLYALLVQSSPGGLRILAMDSQPLPTELYGFCELRSLMRKGRHVVVAGTKGVWRSEDRWLAQPFIEFCVEIDDKGQIRLDLDRRAEIKLEIRGERSVFKSRPDFISKEDLLPEAAHDPCWSLCSFASPTGELWLWAGFHDGRIRCFLRKENPEGGLSWVEGGEVEENIQHEYAGLNHRKPGLTTTAPVWRLHVIEDQQLLVYGSADGIIGIVSLAGAPPQGEQCPHLAHHRESSPICGLVSYTDPEGGKRLLAATQGGVVIVFDIEVANRSRPESLRFSFPGLPLDRFALGHEVRAISVVDYDGTPHRELLGCSLPSILVGSNEGSVFKYALALPRGTTRRKVAYNNWCSSLLEHREVRSADGSKQPPPLNLFVGENISGWLRILDVRGVHLLRYSISLELRERWPLDKLPTLAQAENLQAFLVQLNDLADEIYGRRPLTPEPAKIIWEEASRIANNLAFMALEAEEPEPFLVAFLELNKTIDDLCNRWIGAEQKIESRVLMHIFNCLFDWVGVVLIGLAHPSETVLLVRRFLLHNLIRRRLIFNDRVVYFEALRNLNVALIRAIRNVRPIAGEPPRWDLSLRPEKVGRLGLYDLFTMVGDLGEQHAGSLTPSNPLWTELSKFFAASLLLLPRGSFVISQVVAESRLTERDTLFSRAVQVQAEIILTQLGIDSTVETKLALRQFGDSFDDNIDIDAEILHSPRREKEQDVSTAWGRLLNLAAEAERLVPSSGYDDFSNEAFLLDHAAAIRTAAYLVWLTNEEPLPSREKVWLSKPSHYFEHSRIYLNHLLETWRQVRTRVGLGGRYNAADLPGKASISSALQLCDREEAYIESMADLFEPQRAQYVRVIEQWREQIWKRAEGAIGLLDVLDKFNRHTYRASSDRLMSSITELALQTAPLWPNLSGTKSTRLLRSEIEDRLAAHPLVRTIFDSGNRLVASTHLAGTLFVVARDYYRTSSAPAPRQTNLKEIKAELEVFCQYEDIKLRDLGTFDEDTPAPGTLAVWDTVLQEIVKNVAKYCKAADQQIFATCEWVQGRVQLAFAARRPFIDCLDLDHRQYVDDSLPSEQRLSRLRELVAKAQEPGQRLAPLETAEEGSSGMGLTLILRICGYLGMEAGLLLRDLEATSRRGIEEIADEEKTSWPLCLEISWKGRS